MMAGDHGHTNSVTIHFLPWLINRTTIINLKGANFSNTDNKRIVNLSQGGFNGRKKNKL